MIEFTVLHKQYLEVKNKIRTCILKQEELRELNGFPNNTKGGNGQVVNGDDKMISFVARLCELETEQKQLQRECDRLEAEIYKYLAYIENPTARYVCEIRLLTRSNWKKIQSKVDLSYSRTRQLFYDGYEILKRTEEAK